MRYQGRAKPVRSFVRSQLARQVREDVRRMIYIISYEAADLAPPYGPMPSEWAELEERFFRNLDFLERGG